MSQEGLMGILCILILLSGFFSGSETGLMSLNRYRLKHLIKKRHPGAKRVSKMLERPDRLLGVILLGNTFTNIVASSVATMWAVSVFGDLGPLLSTIILTFVILIFSEMTPKTLAALSPERVAFAVSLPLMVLQKICYPLVWILSVISNSFLRLFGVKIRPAGADPISKDELRTIVQEARGKISVAHQEMLLRILDLEDVTVNDVMVPKSEMRGLDLDAPLSELRDALMACSFSWIPVYRGQIDHVHGLLQVRRALHHVLSGDFDQETLLKIAAPAYFIPEHTPLSKQMQYFRVEQREIGLVVDEYGDIQGLLTLDDVLEEIVGQFSGTISSDEAYVFPQKDGSVLVDGRIAIRELNRSMGWHLSELGPKTLSGLIVEHLEMMPSEGLGLRVNGLPIEILHVSGHTVKMTKILPALQLMAEKKDDDA